MGVAFLYFRSMRMRYDRDDAALKVKFAAKRAAVAQAGIESQ